MQAGGVSGGRSVQTADDKQRWEGNPACRAGGLRAWVRGCVGAWVRVVDAGALLVLGLWNLGISW